MMLILAFSMSFQGRNTFSALCELSSHGSGGNSGQVRPNNDKYTQRWKDLRGRSQQCPVYMEAVITINDHLNKFLP